MKHEDAERTRERVTHLTRAAASIFYVKDRASAEDTIFRHVCEAALKQIEAECSHQIEVSARVLRPRRRGLNRRRKMIEWCTICRKILHAEG